MKIKKMFFGLLAIHAMVAPLSATTYSWLGGTADLTDAANWNPNSGPPTIGDVGTFGASSNLTPNLTASALAQASQYSFDGTNAYTFVITGSSNLEFHSRSKTLAFHSPSRGFQETATALMLQRRSQRSFAAAGNFMLKLAASSGRKFRPITS